MVGEDPALTDGVAAYLNVLRWGVPAGLLGIGVVRAFLPAIGLERLLIWVIPAGVVLNLVLNIWFIYGGLGLPAYGMVGSAAATTTSLWVSAVALLALLHFHRAWRHHVMPHRPRTPQIVELLVIGVPVAVTILVEATLFLATALMIGELGPLPLAAHMVAISVASCTFMVPMAIAQAANVRVAHESGAGNATGARHAGFTGIAMSAVFMGATAAMMLLIPRHIVALYLGAGAAAVPLAATLLRIAGAFQIFDGIQVTAGGALRGLKDTRVPMIIATIGYWGIGFWLGRYLAFDAHLGAAGPLVGPLRRPGRRRDQPDHPLRAGGARCAPGTRPFDPDANRTLALGAANDRAGMPRNLHRTSSACTAHLKTAASLLGPARRRLRCGGQMAARRADRMKARSARHARACRHRSRRPAIVSDAPPARPL